MKKNSIIALLLIIILFLCVYLFCDKVLSSNSNDNNEIQQEENKTDNSGTTVVSVVPSFIGEAQLADRNTGEKYMLDDGSYAYYSLKIPKIDSELEGAVQLNNKILKQYQYYIDIVKDNGNVDSFKGLTIYDVYYDYNIDDYILYISMKSNSKSSSSVSAIDPVYVYDIKNDKELGIIEVLKKKNADIDYVKSTLKENFEDMSSFGYDSEMYNNAKNAIDTLSYDYFIIDEITEDTIIIRADGYPITVTVNIG